MYFFQFVLGGLLLAPCAVFAQSAEPLSSPRFYGGLGLYTSSHQDLGGGPNGHNMVPVQAVLGYQLRPRLALQLGLTYSGYRSSYDYSPSNNPPSSGTIVAYSIGTFTNRSTTATLLARYLLTRKLEHRFQADLLGGVKFEYSAYRDAGNYYDNRQQPTVSPYDSPSTYTCTLLSLGPSLRYRVASRLEAVYDLTFDLPVGGGNYSDSPYSANRQLQATMALGLRYHFGRS